MSVSQKPETFLFGLMTGIAVVATVQYFISITKRTKHDQVSLKQQQKAVQERDSVLAMLDNELVVTSSRLQRIVLHMVSEFKKGLVSEGEMVQMLPSYVVKRPTGNEIGTVLALDLGGTK
jgi:hexokinase